HREGNVKAHNILLVAITLMFSISSFDFLADAVVIMASMKDVFVDNIGTSFIEKQTHFAEKFTLLGSVQEGLVPLE
ncbi:hypothetical protein AAF712_016278, partial [Marasmius tenuissimus]